tara:strand:- start:4 stop:564 length:561 start_codon:yes stop_codon:yes gene_type:complete
MSALVSAQENVLSGTWDQKYDLTIPSLEMPSTLGLDSKAKREIMMGLTCCYRKELINAVQAEHSWKLTESMLKENQRRLQYTLVEKYTNKQLYTFAALQVLDIYTTYNALKYNCVREVNPILGDSPTVAKMFAVKTLVLIPAIEADIKNERLQRHTMRQVNTMMALVITNNNFVGNRAKRNCQKLP